MIRIAVCDDNEEFVNIHCQILSRILNKMGVNAQIIKCYTGDELLLEISINGKVDIILLDIALRGKNGIEIARKIREEDFSVILIFVSAYDEYCKEIIGVQPYEFLDKPITEEKLSLTLDRIFKTCINKNDIYWYYNNKYRQNISLSEVYYFRSDKRKVFICYGGEEISFYHRLDDVEKEIQDKTVKFIRIHKSFLINLSFVKRYGYENIELCNGMTLEISRKYRRIVSGIFQNI